MKLEEIRKQIDHIDEQVVVLLSKRFSLAKLSAMEKSKNKLPVKNKIREEMVIQSIQQFAVKQGIHTGFVTKLYTMIMKESNRLQKSLLKTSPNPSPTSRG